MSQEIALHTAICHDENWVQTTGIDLDKRRKELIRVILVVSAVLGVVAATGIGSLVIGGMSALALGLTIFGSFYCLFGLGAALSMPFISLNSNKALKEKAEKVDQIWKTLQSRSSVDEYLMTHKVDQTARIAYESLLSSTSTEASKKQRLFAIAQDLVARGFEEKDASEEGAKN